MLADKRYGLSVNLIATKVTKLEPCNSIFNVHDSRLNESQNQNQLGSISHQVAVLLPELGVLVKGTPKNI